MSFRWTFTRWGASVTSLLWFLLAALITALFALSSAPVWCGCQSTVWALNCVTTVSADWLLLSLLQDVAVFVIFVLFGLQLLFKRDYLLITTWNDLHWLLIEVVGLEVVDDLLLILLALSVVGSRSLYIACMVIFPRAKVVGYKSHIMHCGRRSELIATSRAHIRLFRHIYPLAITRYSSLTLCTLLLVFDPDSLNTHWLLINCLLNMITLCWNFLCLHEPFTLPGTLRPSLLSRRGYLIFNLLMLAVWLPKHEFLFYNNSAEAIN